MVRLRTHQIVNLALIVTFFGASVNYNPAVLLILSLPAMLADYMIDMIGHDRSPENGYITRTIWTHSIITAPIWGCLAGLIVYIPFHSWPGQLGQAVNAIPMMIAWMTGYTITHIGRQLVLTGVVGSLIHLLLDSVTENGVYLPFDRVPITHWHSESLRLNGVLVLTSLVTILSPILLPFMTPLTGLPDFVGNLAATFWPAIMPATLSGMFLLALKDRRGGTAISQSSKRSAEHLEGSLSPDATPMERIAAALQKNSPRCYMCGRQFSPEVDSCESCGAPKIRDQTP